MVTSVRVAQQGILENTELVDLGQINIICGRNNSGKSTLLRAISRPELRTLGRDVTSAEREHLTRYAADSSPWNVRDGYGSERAEYARIVGRILASRERWYRNDSETLTAEIAASLSKNSLLSHYMVNVSAVATELAHLLGDFPDTVLIPPKRSVELRRTITFSNAVEATGEGLLNFLLFAKNQPVGSSERTAFDQLLAAFSEISDGYRFDVFPTRDNSAVLHFARASESWLPADVCGLGLQDLLLLLYWVVVSPKKLLLIEEPESHLHPDMQRRFLAYCRRQTERQLFVTTHSNVFLDNAFVDRVFFTTYSDRITVDDATSRASILDDLGYSVTDNLVSDLIVLVEGPLDVPVVEEFLAQLRLDNVYQIKVWPLGGDIMDQLDLSVFASHYRLIADRSGSQQREDPTAIREAVP